MIQQQQSLPSFGKTDSAQEGGLNFGQQANGNTRSQTSQSFPPFGSSTNSSSSTGGFSNPFTAPSGSFSFNTPPVSNPFSDLEKTTPTASQNSGFHGSIFNFDAPSNKRQKDTIAEDKPLFAPGAPSGVSHINGSIQEQPKPATNGFTWPPQQQQDQNQTSNLFQPLQTTQPKQPSVLEQANEQAKASTTDIFNKTNSSSIKDPTDKPSSSVNNIFAHLQMPQTVHSKPTENPFAASIAKFNEDQKVNPVSNMFGNLGASTNQGSTNLFNTTSPNHNPSQSKPSSPEAMQTSPDTTPQKDTKGQFTTSSFMNNAAGRSQTTQEKNNDTPPSSGGLFDRVSKPTSEPSAQTPPAFDFNGEGQSTAGGLLGGVSTPASSELGMGTSKALSVDENGGVAETSDNPFGELKVLGSAGKVSSLGTPQDNGRESEPSITHLPTDSDSPKQVESNTDRTNSEVIKDDGPWSVRPAPSFLRDEERVQYYIGSRLKSLDLALRAYLKKYPHIKDTRHIKRYYDQLKKAMLDAGDGPIKDVTGNKRQASSITQAISSPTKRPRTGPILSSSTSNTQRQQDDSHPPIFDRVNGALQPSDTQERQDNNHTTTSDKANGPLQPPVNTNTKRKADEELSRDGTTSVTENAKRLRQPSPPQMSQTAAMFSGILDPSDEDSSQGRPEGTVSEMGDSAILKPTPNLFHPVPPSTSNSFNSILGGTPIFPSNPLTASSNVPTSSSISSNLTLSAQTMPSQSPALASAQSHSLFGEAASPFIYESSSITTPSAHLPANTMFRPFSGDKDTSLAPITSKKNPAPLDPATTFPSDKTAPTVSKPPGQSSDLVDAATNPFGFSSLPATNPSANSTTSSVFKPLVKARNSPLTSGALKNESPPSNSATTGSTEKTVTTTIKPPNFNHISSTNFMAQFGEAAKKQAEEAKNKRKADEYDSEEEDEATWEKKDAEEQKKKRKKIEESAKTAPKFILTSDISNASGPATFRNTLGKSTPEPQPKSVFDSTHPAFNDSSHHNIFRHLTHKDTNPATRKIGDGDEEEDENEPEEATSAPEPIPSSKLPISGQSLGKSLFDRVTKDDKVALSSKSDSISSQGSPLSDHTWKADSPIKFSASTTSLPDASSTNVSTASSSKPPFTGLFGAGIPAQTPTKPGASIFSNLPSSTPSNGLSFGFGPVKPSVGTLAAPSNISSRATSPGATTGESAAESATEGTEDSTDKPAQLDLMSERVGEENEDVLYEVRAKGLRFDSETKAWISKGVGPLRVLKHRETGKRRILLRADPSGKVVINSGFLKEGKYENIGCNTVRGLLADESGGIGLWHLRVKNAQENKQLWEVLDENKKYGS